MENCFYLIFSKCYSINLHFGKHHVFNHQYALGIQQSDCLCKSTIYFAFFFCQHVTEGKVQPYI